MSTAKIAELVERATRRAKRVAAARDHGEQGKEQDVKMPRTHEKPENEGPKPARRKQPPEAAEEVQNIAKQRYEAAKKDQEALTTPMNKKIKKSPSAVDDEASQPKLSRAIQSKQVLGADTEAKSQVTHPAAKSTAVKAKAAPTKPVKDETESATAPNTPQTQAIRECLRRKSTDNFHSTPGRPSPAPSTPTSTATPNSGANAAGVIAQQGTPTQQTENTQKSQQPDDAQEESSDTDEEEIARLARVAKAKREARARYMRFSRSLTSPRTPKEVQRAGRAAAHNSPMLQVLMEQWTACGGIWSESEMFLQMRQKRKNRSYGSRRWMCLAELAAKFGSQETARQIVAAKENDSEACKNQIRPNPDLHGVDTPETRQYLVWDREGTEESVDHVTGTLFRAADRDDADNDPPRGRSKTRSKKKNTAKAGKAKDKKKKKKASRSTSTSSSASSKSASSSSKISSSDGEAKKKRDKGKKVKKAKGDKKRKQRKASKSKSSSKSESAEEPTETEAQKRKRLQKEEAKAEREKKQEAEKEKRRQEKEKTDAFKKDQRKGNQALTKLGLAIAKGSNIDGSLQKMSPSVVTAIMAEVKPHISALKTSRQKLQKSVDEAKVDQLGSLYADIDCANNKLDVFNKFLAAYNVK